MQTQQMSRSRSNSPVRFKFTLKAITDDGDEFSSEELADCVDRHRLRAIVQRKRDMLRKKQEEGKKQAQNKLLEIARKHCPHVLAVEVESEGGLTDTGCMHYFHGPRADIGTEFNTNFSLEIRICLPFTPETDSEGELDFDNQVCFSYVAHQDYDAGSTKVSFETTSSTTFLSCGDFDSLPLSKDSFTEVFLELIRRECDQETTHIVESEFLAKLGDTKIKFEETK